MEYKTNLLEYLSKEENNLLTSLVNYRHDVDAFAQVDGHFQAPVPHIEVPADNDHARMVVGLYLFTHYHLYLSFATLLRCHLSDSLASTRKAIDATLTAYRLHLEPGTLQAYLAEDASYRFITSTIKHAIKQDNNAYPLAPPLLELHGICSQYGSHADVSSFVHRVKVTPLGSGRAQVEHMMFQFPDDEKEFRYYLASTLSAYMLMLAIYADPLTKLTKDFDVTQWTEAIKALTASIEKVRAALAKGELEERAKNRPNERPSTASL